jgi:hypothetical protein
VEEDADVAEGILAAVAVAEAGPDDGIRVAVERLAVAAALALAPVAPATAGAVAVAGRWPPAEAAVPAPLAPRVAQPAVSAMTPASAAAVVSALDRRARLRLPFRPNITSILPACIRSRTGDARRHGQITHFGFRIFRYLGLRVVSPML